MILVGEVDVRSMELRSQESQGFVSSSLLLKLQGIGSPYTLNLKP